MLRVGPITAAFLVSLSASVAVCGCFPDARPTVAPARVPPAYAGRWVALFDGAIEPAAVGLNLELRKPPSRDKVLRERAQQADAVMRVRVRTVTRKAEEVGSSFELVMTPLQRLGGKLPPTGDFAVSFPADAPAHGIVDTMETRLVGASFIAFVHEFTTADGRQIRGHFAPDSKEVAAAVHEAVVLEELR